MTDRVRAVNYYHVRMPDRPGVGSEILSFFRKERVSFTAVHAFPDGNRVQVDFVPKDSRKFLRVARKARLRVSKKKNAFLVEGSDRVGALSRILEKTAEAEINITAVTAVSGGKGRFGAIFWVKPKDYRRAARALGAKR